MSIPANYRGMFEDAGSQTGVDSNLLGAMAQAESSFNHGTVSGAGAKGLMQLMPETARSLGVDPKDPAQNVLGGAKYIKSLMDQFGDLQTALAAYNAGPGRVQQAMRRAGSTDWDDIKQYLPRETQDYVPKVMRNYGG